MTSTTLPGDEYCNGHVFFGDLETQYQHWFVLPAVIIIVVLAFSEKRKTVKLDVLQGRPGLVRPFSFLDEPSNRWGIMFAFGAVTSNILSVTFKTFSEDFPIWAKVFLVYILSIETSLITYPLFACMTTRHRLVGAISGLFYSVVWFVFQLYRLIEIGRCLKKYRNPYWQNDVAGGLIIQELPAVIFGFLVVLKFILKLYKCIKKKQFVASYKNLTSSFLCRTFHIQYVRLLVQNRKYLESSMSNLPHWRGLMNRIWCPVDGFRFSIAMMITALSSSVFVYIAGLYGKLSPLFVLLLATATTRGEAVTLLLPPENHSRIHE